MSAHAEKVGEMFMVGFDGTDAAAASDLIQRRMVGGIILFTRNIRDASHAAEVCWKLQQMRRNVSDSPLFISIDQEGGCVARITEGVTVLPGAMALGAAGSERLARQAGGVTGAELSALGINVNFAPVLDISSNPANPGVGARSFGSNPQLAARLGSSVKEKLRFLDSLPQPLEPRTSLSEDIASKAVTIVRNEDSTIPLRLDASERLAVVVPAFEALTKVEEAAGPHEVLLRELGRRHAEPLYVKIPVEPSRAELREHVETCRGADRLLILTYNMHRYKTQCELVRALLRLEKPAVVAAVRDPYDLALVPEARACLATYSFRDCSMKALIEVLFGEIEAGGTLPVDLELSGEQ